MWNDSPCRDCQDRVADPNCHATCQKYIDWCKKHEERKEKLRNQTLAEYNLYRKPVVDAIRKSKKKK